MQAVCPPLAPSNARSGHGRALQVPRAQSGNGVAAEAADGVGSSSSSTVARGLARPVLVPPSWEQTVRAAPQLFPRSQHAGSAQVPNRLRVFSGTSNPALSQEVACYLGLELGGMKIKRFADGEIYVQVRGRVWCPRGWRGSTPCLCTRRPWIAATLNASKAGPCAPCAPCLHGHDSGLRSRPRLLHARRPRLAAGWGVDPRL